MTTTVTIDTAGHWLCEPAASSFLRAVSSGCPTDINSAGRTYAEQAGLYAKWKRGEGAFALPPGTSQHERGNALDLDDGAREWMLAHPQYGWRRTNPAERWHFEHDPALDTTTQEDDDMDDKTVRSAVADETRKVLVGNEFQKSLRNALRDTVPDAVWSAQIERGGLGPARSQDWIGDTRLLVGQLTATAAGLASALSALATAQGLDPAGIEEAARKGATEALSALTLTAVTK